jgi:hypothetical protein
LMAILGLYASPLIPGGGSAAAGIVIGLILGLVIGLPLYLLGVLISAQGQILSATLDTAVNTSPLISATEVSQMLSVD